MRGLAPLGMHFLRRENRAARNPGGGRSTNEAHPICRAVFGNSAGSDLRPGIFYPAPPRSSPIACQLPPSGQIKRSLAGFPPAAASGIYDRPLCPEPSPVPPGPSHENPGGLACHLLRVPSPLPQPELSACHRSRRSSAMASRCRSNAGAYRRMTPEIPASLTGQRGLPCPWPFRTGGSFVESKNHFASYLILDFETI